MAIWIYFISSPCSLNFLAKNISTRKAFLNRYYTHVANSDFETGGPTASKAFDYTSTARIPRPCHIVILLR